MEYEITDDPQGLEPVDPVTSDGGLVEDPVALHKQAPSDPNQGGAHPTGEAATGGQMI